MSKKIKLVSFYNKYRKNIQYKFVDFDKDLSKVDHKLVTVIDCDYNSLKQYIDEEVDGETFRHFRLGLIIKSDVIPDNIKVKLKSYCLKYFDTVIVSN